MEMIWFVLAIVAVGLMMTGFFILGMLFMKNTYHDAQVDAWNDRLRYEFYRLAGVQKPTDPRPYVPPRPITPRKRSMLPGMSALDRLMHEGKRGTIMWRAGDRKN